MENENLKDNRKHIISYSVLSVLLIASIIWVCVLQSKNRNLQNTINNDYNRAFSELAGYVDNIETNLRKSMLVSSPAQLASISNELFRQSAAAKASLGELPVTEVQLDNTAKFLSQVGDYTYVVSQNTINGKTISDEDYKNLQSLTSYAASLNSALSDTLSRIYSGEINLSGNKNTMSTTALAAADILSDMENVEKSFEEYPSLIYDGPFSEHIENRDAAMLKGKSDISVEEAKKAAEKFLGSKGKNLKFESQTQNTPAECYTFTGGDNNEISVSITKKGGYVLYYLNNRTVNEEKLNFSDCIKIGENFLKKNGFTSITSSYYDKSSNIATLNFAYIQDGVTCYSDLLKVKIALDNGEILGLETNGYIMNHEKRNLKAPAITSAQAREKINKHLNVESGNLALIPKDSLQEVLCYEFHGSFDGKNYIIYINADNGHEEKILMLLESENGILTE